MSNGVNKTVNVGKSVGASIALTFFFGPIGMFYSTLTGAIIMLVLYLVIGLFTLGLGLIVLHPIAIIWGAVEVSNYNKKLAGTL